MNKKISKFLICTNPMVGSEQYIFCSRDPEMLLKVNQAGGEINLEVMEVYSGTQEDVDKAINRAKDWYIALKAFTKK